MAKLTAISRASPLAGCRWKRQFTTQIEGALMATAKSLGSALIGGAVLVPILLHSAGFGWLGPYAFTVLLVGAVVVAADETIKRRLGEK
jgi:hypothetical protein